MEVISTMVIVLLLGANLLIMINASSDIWHSAITRSENHQAMRHVYRIIEREMKSSNILYVTDNTESLPQAFAFLSALNHDQRFVTDINGRPLWQRYTIYYIPRGTDNLMRREVYGSFTEALSPQQLAEYCDGQGKVVSKGVSSISMEMELPENRVVISITSNRESPGGKTDSQRMDFTVTLLN